MLDSYGAVTLYDNRLEAPEGVAPLSPAIEATIDASGELTSNSDTRELYLTLDTPSYQALVRCAPGDTAVVRELAAAINTAAKNAEKQIRDHDARKQDADEALERARSDTAALQAAQTQLEAGAGGRGRGRLAVTTGGNRVSVGRPLSLEDDSRQSRRLLHNVKSRLNTGLQRFQAVNPVEPPHLPTPI